MGDRDGFIKKVRSELPDDRLTFQKSVPTLHPQSVEETSVIFSLANGHDQKLFITGFGNNISPQGHEFREVVAIKSDRLNRLIRIVPADYYIVVGCGYPLREINRALKEHSLFMPHADLPYVGSVGGALASGLCADFQGQTLPLSRYFIMAEIVDPTGKIIIPGSACFKSVSGLDIVKIFSPSWGLLGMIVSAYFRVLPTTAREDYAAMKMMPARYEEFAGAYRDPGDNVSAQYSIKIKNKFDPNEILPLISGG
jgi:glycolate oxidase FAD binding subunit